MREKSLKTGPRPVALAVRRQKRLDTVTRGSSLHDGAAATAPASGSLLRPEWPEA